MKNYTVAFYFYNLILLIFPLMASAQIISKEPKDLFSTGSESIIFTSEINGKGYKLFVKLPENYQTNSEKEYPVYYALDGYWTFAIAASINKSISEDGFAPEMIIIGISYPGDNPDYGALRESDLSPTVIKEVPSSGDAPKFLKVLSDEIIPMIDSIYRTDKTNRTLTGSSLAGLFALYTLFTQPSLFNHYIIHNPSLWWDNGYMFQLEKNFAKRNTNINARVMMVSGEYDGGKAEAAKMVEQIKKHQYKNMALNFRVVENMGHGGSEAEGVSQGMIFLYKQRPIIILPENELKAYTGTYKIDNLTYEIIIKDKELTMITKFPDEEDKINALNKSEFSMNGNYFDFHFNRDKNGKVIGFFYQQNLWGGSVTALKIK
jgi:predicted alpha/beta superfamily hydrolase